MIQGICMSNSNGRECTKLIDNWIKLSPALNNVARVKTSIRWAEHIFSSNIIKL